jgi:adenylate cyclase
MAFFNAPVNVKDHADATCHAALEMLKNLDLLNEQLKEEGKKTLDIGIGINTAEVIVGNMGSNIRFNYTVVGDGVNLASRVESLTKKYDVEILITEFTVKKLKEDFLYRKIEPVQVKGKEKSILLYQLMSKSKNSLELKNLYDKALQYYIDNDLSHAKKLFEHIVIQYDDSLSKYFLSQIKTNTQWGIKKMQSK